MISRVCYCNRTEAQRAIDFKDGLDVNAALDRAMMSAADNIDGDMKRVYFPSDDTRYFDWPNQGGSGGGQYAEPWRLYLDDNDLACLTSLVSGGVTIPLSAIFLLPVNNPQKGKPYFSYIELDRSQSYAFGNNAQTPQLSIAMAGTWAYSALADPAGTLAANVGSSDTTVTVSDGSQAGPGDLIILGYGRGSASGSLPWAAGIQPFQGERCLITDVTMISTAVTFSGPATASASDNVLAVPSGGAFNRGEVILLDAERMLIEDVNGNNLTLRRAWDGTVLAAHTSGTIYAGRQFTVSRAQLGTTASSYSSGAAVYKHRIPPLIHDLAIAESDGRLLQEGSGYARTVGSGEAAHPAPGVALADLWDEARMRHGRKARTRGVLAMATTRVVLSGPIFDGQASEAARDFTDSLAHEIAEIGRDWIRIEAMGYDKSGRGGTGAAAEGVELSGGNGAYVILGGIRQGKYAWPWLEGDSKRNQSTGFPGYHAFRRTRLRMRKQVTPFAQARIEQYLLMMGGGET